MAPPDCNLFFRGKCRIIGVIGHLELCPQDSTCMYHHRVLACVWGLGGGGGGGEGDVYFCMCPFMDMNSI